MCKIFKTCKKQKQQQQQQQKQTNKQTKHFKTLQKKYIKKIQKHFNSKFTFREFEQDKIIIIINEIPISKASNFNPLLHNVEKWPNIL